MKDVPLNDLEMFELLQVAYPEKFPNDDDETWNAAQDFADTISGWDEIADLLGRVTTLAMPMSSELSGTLSHCLGLIKIENGQAYMRAVVKRDVT